jgi:hypothetical protein
MNKKDFFSVAYPYILERVKDKSYKWTKSRDALIKKTNNGFHEIQLFFDDYGEYLKFSDIIALRIDRVELFVNYFKFRNHTNDKFTTTHATNRENFIPTDGKQFEFKVYEELYKSLDIYIDFLNTIGLDYIEYCDNIETLAHLYIDCRNDSNIKNKESLALPLILAKLTNRPDLDIVMESFLQKEIINSKQKDDYEMELNRKLFEFAKTGIVPLLPSPPYDSPQYQPPPRPKYP